MNQHRRKKGFTLMEVALAVAVAAIGILALFALLSGGLDFSSKAVSTTQAAFFADATLNALRARSVEIAQTATNANDWANYWTAFTMAPPFNTEYLTVSVPSAWRGVLKVNGTLNANNAAYTLSFQDVPSHGGGVTNISTGTLRYRLLITTDPDGQIPATRRIRRATLHVWPGPGPTTVATGLSTNNALLFYSEYPNVGTL